MATENDDAGRGRGTFQFDGLDGERRLAELILHIANRCGDDPTFGATKLNKILWWADFLSYAHDGEPITGVEYQRLVHGPAPRRLIPVCDDLVRSGSAAIQRRHVFNRVQERIVPLREAQYDCFTASQIALVDRLIDVLWAKSAKEVSEESHGKAWGVVKYGQSIPYEAIFLSDEPIDDADVMRTHALAEHQGWATV